MANIKSAQKRIKVIANKTERNKAIKSKIKTTVKKVNTAIADGNKELANANLHEAIVEISKATSKGIFHANTGSRKISRLTKAVNKLQ